MVTVLRKDFRKLCLIRCRRQHLRIIKQRKYTRYASLEMLLAIRDSLVSRKEQSLVLLTSNFRSFKNPFENITGLSEFQPSHRRFILFVEIKVIFMSYDGSISMKWMRLDPILAMKYIHSNSSRHPLKIRKQQKLAQS